MAKAKRNKRRRKAVALTRRITRRQALSYERLTPNPLGVTHLAVLNGPGAYKRRYAATIAALSGGSMRRKKKRYRRNLEGTFSQPAMPLSELARQVARSQRKSTRKAATATKRKAKRKRKLTKAERRAISLRNLRKARKARGTKTKKSARKSKRRKSARARGLAMRLGGVARRTYFRRTRKGGIGRIPTYKILGFSSPRALKKAYSAGSPSLAKKMDSVRKRRASAAARASKQILEGRGLYSMFTPNRGSKVLSFEEWQKMTPNKRRKKKKSSKRSRKSKLTKAQRRAISLRNLRKARAAKKTKSRRRKGARRSKRGKLTKAQRRAISLRNLRKARAAKKAKKAKRRRKKSTKSRKRRYRRNGMTQVAANPRRRRRRRRRYAANPRRRRRGRRRYYANKRRYRRNFGVGTFVAVLKSAVKVGAVAIVGFGLHRFGSRLIEQHVLSRLPFLDNPTIAPWKATIASVIAMAVGGVGVAMVAPSLAATVAGGMAVSFMLKLATKVSEMLGVPQVAGYLNGYPDAQGSAYGSYYSYRPGETLNGYGEYFEPMSGFGSYGAMTQAAAGYGAPMLSQAAAGMGEYVAYGANAIGDGYEAVPYGSHNDRHIELAPNLSEAEQAMNFSEAVAGVGGYGDLPSSMTVEPTMYSAPVPDEPGGSRAGIMAGRDGIFG